MADMVKIIRRGFRLAGLVTSVALGGCAVHPSQDPDTVRFRSGEVDEQVPAAGVTAHYVPYAIMAAEAYRDVDPKAGFNKRLIIGKIEYDARTAAGVARWMKDWRFEGGQMGPLCRDGGTDCDGPLTLRGLEYQIWTHRRRDGSCDEAALVFRGTDSSSFSDWMSNFHWVVRLSPAYDQYEQVQSRVQAIIDDRVKPLCPGKGTRIVAVGHSLGGGLAQQAAFMSRDIRHVYAFNPSFVAGSTDVHSHTEETRFGLKIDRIYEHGEILAYPRFVWRMIQQPTPCDPQIRTIRVNGLHGSMLDQHRIRAYVGALVRFNPAPSVGVGAEKDVPAPSKATKAEYRCSDAGGPRVRP